MYTHTCTHTDVHKFQTKLYFPTNLTFSSVNVYNIYCENNHGKTVQINYSYASKQQITYCVYFDMVYTHIRPRTLTGRYLTTPDPPFPGFVLISLYIFFIPFFFFQQGFWYSTFCTGLLNSSNSEDTSGWNFFHFWFPVSLALALCLSLTKGKSLPKTTWSHCFSQCSSIRFTPCTWIKTWLYLILEEWKWSNKETENFSICQRGWENWVLTVICTITE